MHLWSLLCYSSGAVAVASPCTLLPLSPSHGAYGERGWGNEVLKQAGEPEVGNTTNFIHCAQVLFELLPLLNLFCRKDFCRLQWMLAACWTMQPGSEGMGYWTKTQWVYPPYKRSWDGWKFEGKLQYLEVSPRASSKLKRSGQTLLLDEGYWRN